ncbi:pyruvate dehydrogenase [NADP(+)]-like [Condylostylus longicornis]|uniref:pyruvate dehydrogenase [NADP(+)]-like n=1 Tax=Condylostylus longicornis TaxID=2530218 RepID=UPI00244E488B|nr:pyruvate dehydrogenase [NADP(+)]-like [Condylostylus longicornis]
MIIANATGCSSIWGASYPSVPYTTNQKGYGPAWGNSLFEDNAEYGYGMIVALQHRRERFHNYVKSFLKKDRIEDLNPEIYEKLNDFAECWQDDPAACTRLFEDLSKLLDAETVQKDSLLKKISDEKSLIPKFSHWVIGGDGWAYDIGFGGLDHVIASGIDVNILVLDTEVYSNTGGQISKATPLGAVHKFGAAGHLRNKKDLGMIAMEYGSVYVASVASSANMSQVVRAFVEAEKYHGPSIILAYAPWIHQAFQCSKSPLQHGCGLWLLAALQIQSDLEVVGEPPLQLDCKKIKLDVRDLLRKENRFEQLYRTNPELAQHVEDQVHTWINKRFDNLKARATGITAGHALEAIGTGNTNRIHILYGSETGNAEDVANRLAALMKQRTLIPQVMQLDEVEVDELADMESVVVICSTAGQGEFPGNGKVLFESLEKIDQKDLLSKMTYAVFGLGDSSYIFFNEAAKKYDAIFADLGGKRLIGCGLGDDQHEEKYETALSEWLPEYWTESKAPEPQNVSDEPGDSMYKVETVTSHVDYKRCIPYGAVAVKLDVSRRMTPDDYDVEVRHLEFDLTGTGLRYALGDSLAIFPESDPQLVEEFCAFFGFDPELKIRIKRAGTESSAKHEALFKQPMSVRQLLSECIDIGGKPNRMFYEILYKYCTDSAEKEKAKALLLKENKKSFLQMTNKGNGALF